jgi:hypothetical protein
MGTMAARLVRLGRRIQDRAVPEVARCVSARMLRIFVQHVPPKGSGLMVVEWVEKYIPPPRSLLRARHISGYSTTCDLNDGVQKTMFYRGIFEPIPSGLILEALPIGGTWHALSGPDGHRRRRSRPRDHGGPAPAGSPCRRGEDRCGRCRLACPARHDQGAGVLSAQAGGRGGDRQAAPSGSATPRRTSLRSCTRRASSRRRSARSTNQKCLPSSLGQRPGPPASRSSRMSPSCEASKASQDGCVLAR